MSIQDYILRMKGIDDSLNSTGLIVFDDELLLYILGGLSSEYDPVVINLTSRHESITCKKHNICCKVKSYVLNSKTLQ